MRRRNYASHVRSRDETDSTLLKTFPPHEARIVEALTACLLPGTPDVPGAREAGVVNYIDNMLAFQQGFVEKTHLRRRG